MNHSARPGVWAAAPFVARFLGREISYTYDVTEIVPDARFVMRTADGPFPMETTYTWRDAASGGTEMTLRNSGEPSGVPKFAHSLMARAIRRANRKDLRRLRALLETRGPAIQR